MQTFYWSCIVAVVIALGAAVVLNTIQKDAEVAYSTSGVRI